MAFLMYENYVQDHHFEAVLSGKAFVFSFEKPVLFLFALLLFGWQGLAVKVEMLLKLFTIFFTAIVIGDVQFSFSRHIDGHLQEKNKNKDNATTRHHYLSVVYDYLIRPL